MGRIRDLTGMRFGRLVAQHRLASKGSVWLCLCDCGETRMASLGSLTSGSVKSCGCMRPGNYKRPEYSPWGSMLERCANPKQKHWASYGGRGIKVCDRWRGERGFANFLADMGPRPSPDHSIDRKDVNGNYEPSNCRWATPTEQARNTRRSRIITAMGVSATVVEWAERSGIPMDTLLERLNRGWSPERAVTARLMPRGPNAHIHRRALAGAE